MIRNESMVLKSILFITLGACAAGAAHAQTFTDFDGFSTGSVNGQFGWEATNANFDQEIVDLGGGNKVWRMSNAVTSGSFGDQPHSPSTGLYHGESGAVHQPSGNTADTNRYFTTFDFKSATGAAQTNLFLSISPDDGAGSRQSYVGLSDTGSGIDVIFYDSQQNNLVTNPNGGFVPTTVASGLSYADWHTITLDIHFVDGFLIDGDDDIDGNDIVDVYVNGSKVHTGTTWESYYQTTTEGQTPPSVRAIDELIFRTSGTAQPGLAGGGYYFDNVSISNIPEPATLALVGLGGLCLIGRRRSRA